MGNEPVEYCKERVLYGNRRYQCTKKAKRDGYCTIHHPEYVAEKKASRRERIDAEWRARQKRMDEEEKRRNHAEDCVNALAGMDPSKLATMLTRMSEVYSDLPTSVRRLFDDLTKGTE
jgi:hypothetical protein